MYEPRTNAEPRPATGLRAAAFTGGDVVALINDRVKSRSWWIFVTAEPCGYGLLGHLEKTFYPGAANTDFQVLVLPKLAEGLGILVVFLAKKSRMSSVALEREIVAQGGPITVEDSRTRDVFVLHPDLQGAAVMAEVVGKLLGWPPRPGGS
jgi:hypothetical protein